MDKHIVLDQDILTGSSRLVKSEKNIFDRNKFFLENMNYIFRLIILLAISQFHHLTPFPHPKQ